MCANIADNGILGTVALAQPEITPHTFTGRATLTNQQLNNAVKNLIGKRRLNRQLIAEECFPVTACLDDICLAADRVHSSLAAVFIELIANDVRCFCAGCLCFFE